MRPASCESRCSWPQPRRHITTTKPVRNIANRTVLHPAACTTPGLLHTFTWAFSPHTPHAETQPIFLRAMIAHHRRPPFRILFHAARTRHHGRTDTHTASTSHLHPNICRTLIRNRQAAGAWAMTLPWPQRSRPVLLLPALPTPREQKTTHVSTSHDPVALACTRSVPREAS